ncbi:MAG: cellulose-binding domain-containing protein, partial [Clostridium sp.]
WVSGVAPGTSGDWSIVPVVNEDGSEEYIDGKAYNGGSLVRYKGKTYKAIYWTNTIPGSDNSWTLVK